jgi:FAD/FMN-containing dehydrogenase
MPFRRHPQSIARRANNAEAVKAAGFSAPGLSDFEGLLVWPNMPQYNADRLVANLAFQDFPVLIAYCMGQSDVALCLNWAQLNSLPFVCRSGGHSTAGYSTINNGLIIDTSNLNTCLIPPFWPPPQPFGLVVGPGAQFGNVNTYLASYGLHTPGGGCPTVCIGGYMQGGGYGFTSREFGINSDNVLAFDMMLANQSVVTANATQNGDLYWAVRGGTGNNFGVLLSVLYQVYELPLVWGVWLQWPLANAAQALYMMQNDYMLSGAPNNLGYMTIIASQNNTPVLMMRIMFDGTEADLDTAIAPLLALPGAGSPPNYPLKQQGTYAQINKSLLEEPYEIPQLPQGPLGEDKQSGYIQTSLTVSDWQAVIDYYQTTPNIYNTLVIEPYGGAINAYPAGDSAFIHRTAAMDFFVDVFWNLATADAGEEKTAKQWLDGYMSLMQPFFNGESYQNYPRRSLPNYPQQYWGTSYPTLQQVKQKYDPGNVFNFQQSIQLPQPGSTFTPIGTAADPFLNQPIVYAKAPGSATRLRDRSARACRHWRAGVFARLNSRHCSGRRRERTPRCAPHARRSRHPAP